jgi:uncharacterized membrane protein
LTGSRTDDSLRAYQRETTTVTQHTHHEAFTCPVCGETRPARAAVHGAMIRPAIVELVRRAKPDWTPHDSVCTTCLHRFRAEYVEDVLEGERGALSRLEAQVVQSLKEQELLTADTNAQFDRGLTLGQRIADRVATFGGSWAFILLFGATIVAWIAVNTVGMLHRSFDPFPFILLNLVLSCLAAIQAPVIMMSQNRQEAKDRLRAENDFRINLKAELEIRHLNDKLDLMLSQHWQQLLEIQRTQMELMEEMTQRRQR